MSNQKSDYAWVGWAVAALIAAIFIFSMVSTHNQKNRIIDQTEPAASTYEPMIDSAWHCVDATSYNQNAFDDNKCTDGTETKYVSDSQAMELDPSYSPGKAGASYYNNQ